MRTCESRCLFSGSKGEVCCIEPLHAGLELKDHPITHYSLLAMASLTKVYSYTVLSTADYSLPKALGVSQYLCFCSDQFYITYRIFYLAQKWVYLLIQVFVVCGENTLLFKL